MLKAMKRGSLLALAMIAFAAIVPVAATAPSSCTTCAINCPTTCCSASVLPTSGFQAGCLRGYTAVSCFLYDGNGTIVVVDSDQCSPPSDCGGLICP